MWVSALNENEEADSESDRIYAMPDANYILEREMTDGEIAEMDRKSVKIAKKCCRTVTCMI